MNFFTFHYLKNKQKASIYRDPGKDLFKQNGVTTINRGPEEN